MVLLSINMRQNDERRNVSLHVLLGMAEKLLRLSRIYISNEDTTEPTERERVRERNGFQCVCRWF